MIILNKNGTSFDTYMNHAKKHNWWKPDTQGKSNEQILKELQSRPVCPQCENIAMRHLDRTRAKCPNCGWQGKTITLDEIITEQLYRR